MSFQENFDSFGLLTLFLLCADLSSVRHADHLTCQSCIVGLALFSRTFAPLSSQDWCNIEECSAPRFPSFSVLPTYLVYLDEVVIL